MFLRTPCLPALLRGDGLALLTGWGIIVRFDAITVPPNRPLGLVWHYIRLYPRWYWGITLLQVGGDGRHADALCHWPHHRCGQ